MRWPSRFDFLVQSWDTAIKVGDKNDCSACVTIGIKDQRYYVVEALTFRANYPDLKRAMIDHYHQHNPDAVVIEDKASGQSLLQDLRREGALPVISYMPKGDKVHRVARMTPLMESGRVLFPARSPWREGLRRNCFPFPTVAMMIRWMP